MYWFIFKFSNLKFNSSSCCKLSQVTNIKKLIVIKECKKKFREILADALALRLSLIISGKLKNKKPIIMSKPEAVLIYIIKLFNLFFVLTGFVFLFAL